MDNGVMTSSIEENKEHVDFCSNFLPSKNDVLASKPKPYNTIYILKFILYHTEVIVSRICTIKTTLCHK